MSISQNFPNTRPSLNLNFARSQTLDPRITFTRTTSGTRVGPDGYIEVIPADQPRFDFDPVTGECLGLLVEESRSNSLLWSEDFSNWTVNNGSVQSNVITAPDGNVTADKLVENSSTGNKEVNRGSITFTSGTSLTYSCFVKASGRSSLRLAATSAFFDLVGTNAYFDLTSGTVHSITGGVTSASIIPYPNGWYRCIATILPTSSGTGNVFITLILSGVTSNYTGDGTSGIYIWGAQLEQGAFPTSYIPTSGSTVTRTSDNVSMIGENFSSWYNQSEGTIVSSWKMPTIPSSTVSIISSFSDGTTNNRFMHYKSEFGANNLVRTSANGTSVNNSFGDIIFNALSKTAFSYETGTTITSYNGSPANVVSQSVPTSVNALYIGGSPSGITDGSVTFSQLTYYPRRLTNAQLITLTR